MADDPITLDDFHFDNIDNDQPWALFEMDPMEEGSLKVNLSVGESDFHRIGVVSATIDDLIEDVPGNGSIANANVERRRPYANTPLDMNDPAVLNEYTSLLLFANNPSAQNLDLESCSLSRQATVQALAAKFDLQYSHDTSLGTIQLRKKTYGNNSQQHEQQLRLAQKPVASSEPLLPLPPPQFPRWNSQQKQHDELSNGNNLSPFLHGDVPAMNMGMIPDEIDFGNFESWIDAGNYSLATPPYPGPSEDEQELCRTRLQSAPILPRRNSWTGLSRTLKEVGACWRCKILRKKCDPEQPCKACPRSGINNSRWQAIGCKRGTLLDHMRDVTLCPKASLTGGIDVDGTLDTIIRIRRAEECLRDASARLDDICVAGGDTYTKVVLEILCSPIPLVTDMTLSLRHDVEANAIHIAWGLIDIVAAKEVLHIKSAEQTLDVMKAAITYETEYGLSQAVPIATECFVNCIQILRLYEGGHLVPEVHDDCKADKCQIQPFQDLTSNVKSFTDELSKVIFRKENRLHEKRWWLSTFYGLWIQSYVRRTIKFVEAETETQLSSETRCADATYLLLALELFEAASASFDPLMSAWSLEEEPPHMDLRLVKYYRLAQKALFTEERWICDTGGSIEYLRHLYHDRDSSPTVRFKDDIPLSSMSSMGNDDTESHGAFSPFSPRPSIFQSHKMAQSSRKFSVPLRTRSGAKRRAGSPLQDTGFMRRNGSSSSVLDGRDVRSRGLPIASPASPMSSAYSFAYGTSSSTRWNGSGDSLAEMARFYGTSPPNHRDQFNYLSPSKGNRPSLNYKSSNESFLELPRTLNKRRPASSNTNDGLRGLFVCECCPKKPKKFDTMEELSAHENERKYQCSFCGTRFKSKNEAERHENSLHVRRQAWSCSNILKTGYTNIFQESLNQPGIADTCGYCGEDFLRSGEGIPKHATEKDWDERLTHVRETHKFGECNSSKKFYRADHFRQHVKHSHSATLGRWINALESVCMIDVPDPKKSGDEP
ncbi:uncharacterized protein F4822DRAFT_53714 [Hypoxylon trugodes]|uniref:uncharacterized protein n=1 Tax=Hypoxylon trugodes TaxID=326681 RepID=UPI00219B699D|nr:uncharacterized protein F4822DRAFT_53714 [Hypoxylon trugodes]KAI1383864.1 hypothetical protein F4822DRAFT_53714 [Hypoxylon trugodes]